MKPTKEDFLNAVAKSIEHHTDGMTRTEKDFRHFKVSANACELCNLFGSTELDDLTCSPCPLYRKGSKKCAEEYHRAVSAKEDRNYPAFIKAETALVRRLKTMLCPDFYDGYYGKDKETEVPDFAPYVQKKEGQHYYYMGVWNTILSITILIYNINSNKTDIFKVPDDIDDFFLGYMFDDGKKINTFDSSEDINTIAKQFTSYCESLEKNKTKK